MEGEMWPTELLDFGPTLPATSSRNESYIKPSNLNFECFPVLMVKPPLVPVAEVQQSHGC